LAFIRIMGFGYLKERRSFVDIDSKSRDICHHEELWAPSQDFEFSGTIQLVERLLRAIQLQDLVVMDGFVVGTSLFFSLVVLMHLQMSVITNEVWKRSRTGGTFIIFGRLLLTTGNGFRSLDERKSLVVRAPFDLGNRPFPVKHLRWVKIYATTLISFF
jgi:hypothetical protein